MVLVNKRLSEEVITAAQQYTPEILNIYIHSCADRLSCRLIVFLQTYFVRSDVRQINNVGSTKNTEAIILGVKVRIALAIKDIPQETITRELQDSRPWLMHNLPELAVLALQDRINPTDELKLTRIALSLMQAGHLDTALTFFDLIANPRQKNQILAGFADSLVVRGRNVDGALHVINLITDPGQKDHTLGSVATVLARRENVDGALHVINLITDPGQKAHFLGSVAGTLAEAGNVDGALYVINLIEDQENKNGQLYTVAEFLVEFGHADRAFAFLNLIEASESKNFLLGRFCYPSYAGCRF
jgi:hypothetical protein